MPVTETQMRQRALLRQQGIKTGKALIGPEVVQVQITDRCQLSCRYCYFHAPSSRARPGKLRDIPFARFKDVVRDCADLRVDALILSGEGEPSVHPRFFDMLKHVEKMPFQVHLVSNGAFPMERCRDILRADSIKINLSEVERRRYRALQGRDLFLRVTRNIRELARLRKKIKPDFLIEIVFVLNRLNVAHAGAIKLLGKGLGADLVSTVPVEIYPHTQELALPGSCAALPKVGQRRGPWCDGWHYAAIRLDGRVSPCCYLRQMVMADLKRSTFKKAWRSPGYAQARRLLASGEFPGRDVECRRCGRWRGVAHATSAHRGILA